MPRFSPCYEHRAWLGQHESPLTLPHFTSVELPHLSSGDVYLRLTTNQTCLSRSRAAAPHPSSQPAARNTPVGTCGGCAGMAARLTSPKHGGLHPRPAGPPPRRIPAEATRAEGEGGVDEGLSLTNQGCNPTSGMRT